ncbi:hypothetical protein SAMN05421640_0987 [Ekhidna lutea]|uniref:TonB dependent receptor n=1 Tax=Ekhidna lutea TaxID=447679 RepID=A0A239GS97_EKHLU|nr:hypothetical protein [Ekhidna lutea]SNS72086.1 hypothetical protein SAMN05421640_0987 [Ekhidna lutea]
MRYLFLTILVLISSYAIGQQVDTTQTSGEIISGKVVIEKDKKIRLPKGDKIFLRGELKSLENQSIRVSFQAQEPTFEWPDYKSDVPFKSTETSYPLEQVQNFVKLGYGNYNSPLFKAGLYQSFGELETRARLGYESFASGPIGEENSGNVNAGFGFSASYNSNNLTIRPSFSYDNFKYHFYGNNNRVNTGFNPENAEEVSWRDWQFSIDLSGGQEGVSYKIRPFYNSTSQILVDAADLNNESIGGVSGSLKVKIDDSFSAELGIDGKSGSYDGGITYDRNLLNVNPSITYQSEELSLSAGLVISSGETNEATETSLYPDINLTYELSDRWSVYGLVSGGMEWNGLSTLLNQNEFLDDSLAISFTENTIKLGGGLKGAILENMLLETSVIHRSTNGLPFFVSSTDSSRFILTYDAKKVSVLTFASKLSYMPTNNSSYGLNLELNGYSLESLDRPWHMPAYEIEAFTSHNINEKLILSAFLNTKGGIRGPANVDFGYVSLPAFIDVGLGMKYLITPQASAFIDVNNLLNNEYERYLGYPTRGLAFKIGGQYRF